MKRIFSIVFVCLLPVTLWAQTTASLSGQVTDPSGAAVANAVVTLSNALTGFERRVETDVDGRFALSNIPLQSYALLVQKDGFKSEHRPLGLRSNVPIAFSVELQLADRVENIQVSAFETSALVDTESTGTRTELNLSAIERMPVQIGSRGLEALLLSFPGFAANANGAIHPRGAHNQMTYVVDGMAISDQLTGSFATSIDPSIVQTVELFTGNIPAEFGSKISGVANITTRSGLDSSQPFSGSIEVGLSQFDTFANVTQFGGKTGRLGYFASFHSLKSNRFLDQVSLDNLHNGGNSERGFTRFDVQASPTDHLRLNLMAGRSSFQLANLRSQHLAGQQQRQLLRDGSVSLAWLHTLNPRATVDSGVSYRTSVAQLFPSAGDTPVTAAQARHLSTLSLGSRINAVLGAHTLRAGFDLQYFPVSENFSFGITSPDFNSPASEDFIPTLLAHDLSRGGQLFHFSKKASGRLSSVFVQDQIRWSRFAFSLGARYDDYSFLVEGNQLQPRVGLSFYLQETGTVFRASYNRTYQTPPNENLLLSNSEESSALVPADVRETLGGALIRIRPERQDVYEVGLQQAIGRHASLNGSFYHKNSTDMQDNDNFFNTGIIFPTSLKQSRVNGAELRLAVPRLRSFSGSLSLTHYHVVVTPPFTGGLFLGSTAIDLLTAGPFVIDHDQKLGVHAFVRYDVTKALWVSGAFRYDSGLVSNPSDPVEVANDPDYADLLPYVNLTSDPPRVRPRSILDAAVGYQRSREGRMRWDVQLQVTNLTNRTAAYNFQSIFVGTRLVQPRSLGVKLRWFW
jgi:TonB dependent receptor/Carboxypeptidase regulatory-like domain